MENIIIFNDKCNNNNIYTLEYYKFMLDNDESFISYTRGIQVNSTSLYEIMLLFINNLINNIQKLDSSISTELKNILVKMQSNINDDNAYIIYVISLFMSNIVNSYTSLYRNDILELIKNISNRSEQFYKNKRLDSDKLQHSQIYNNYIEDLDMLENLKLEAILKYSSIKSEETL